MIREDRKQTITFAIRIIGWVVGRKSWTLNSDISIKKNYKKKKDDREKKEHRTREGKNIKVIEIYIGSVYIF